jgi:hypothetical protein
MVCTRCGIIGADARPNVSLLQRSTPLPRWVDAVEKVVVHRWSKFF